MRIIAKYILVVLLASSACAGAATTRYVSRDGTNDVTGGYTDWPGAATNIQSAVDKADADDTILVSNGTYTIASGAQVVNIIKSLDVRSFLGRDVTIIDGSAARRCVTIGAVGAGNPIYLTGFTIMNGATNQGAGVYAKDARDIYISDCVISNNISKQQGGGAYSAAAGTLVLSNCAIVNNSCTVGWDGGAMYGNGPIRLLNSVIMNNTGGIGVGRFFYDTFFQDCVISRNVGNTGGGGLSFTPAAPAINKSIIINRCTFSENSNVGATEGGAINIANGIAYISNCVVRGNSSESSPNYGCAGILTRGGGRITDCLIVGNICTNTAGGGLFVYTTNYSLVCENLTIVSNVSGRAGVSKDGGGLYVMASTNSGMLNSIIYGNSGGGAGKSNVAFASTSVATFFYFTNCCVAPLTSVTGPGNIEGPPLYVNVTDGNYHLAAGSPCINRGTNMPWMDGATDLDGLSRLDRFSRLVDMGAYEFLPRGTLFTIR